MKFSLYLMMLLLASATPAWAFGDGILLATGGGPGSTQFFVHLNPAGLLVVERHGAREKIKTVELQLSKGQAHTLVMLAAASDDFSTGCNTVSDGTNAEMKVVKADVTSVYHCFGASKWPVGLDTKTFIDSLNALLPNDFHVF